MGKIEKLVYLTVFVGWTAILACQYFGKHFVFAQTKPAPEAQVLKAMEPSAKVKYGYIGIVGENPAETSIVFKCREKEPEPTIIITDLGPVRIDVCAEARRQNKK